MSEVTRILSAVAQGDPHAASQLLPLVYDKLRQLAAARLAQLTPGQTLQPTALVRSRGLPAPGRRRRGAFFLGFILPGDFILACRRLPGRRWTWRR
jgi:hypothetical protein